MVLISKSVLSVKLRQQIPVAARSKAWEGGRSFAGILSSCECCVLSGRGLCVGLITSPEES